ncbi:MAG: hypothetical protein WCF19_05335 [Chlamydiales bacterium]
MLLGNIGTMQTHNETLDILTNTNQALTADWTTGSASSVKNPAIPGPPGGAPVPGGMSLQDQLDYIDNQSGNVDDEAAALQAFITTYMTSGDSGTMAYPISDYSQAVGTQLMNILSTCYGSSKLTNAAADMATLNSFSSIIQAKANYEEAPGQNEAKTEGSVIQQDTSAQQPIANCNDSIQGIFGNLASLVQQIYS